MPALRIRSKTKNPMGLIRDSLVDVRVSDYETIRDKVKLIPRMMKDGIWWVWLVNWGCVELKRCKRADPRTICKRCRIGFIEPKTTGFCDACTFLVDQQ